MQETSASRWQNPESGLETYRSISALAILSLIFGLLSVAALANPLTWFIPLIGLMTGVLALMRLKVRAHELTGKSAALLGVTLSLLFGTWAPANYFSNVWLLERTSRNYCREWLQFVVHGELQQAHQAYLQYFRRQPKGTSLEEHYASSSLDQNGLTEFFAQSVMEEMQQFSSEATIEHVRCVHIGVHPDYCVAQHVFQISEGDESIQIRIRAERLVKYDTVFWSIIRVLNEAEVKRFE